MTFSLDDLNAELYPQPDPYVDDPVGWIRTKIGEQLWSKQVDVIESVRRHRRTVVPSCHGAGKSHLASRIAGWWIDVHPLGSAFVVTTAPSFAQVRTILWRYIGQLHKKAKLPGRVNQTEWWLDDEIVGYGRKPADEDEEGFQGTHAPFVLVIVDEAAGIPKALWKGIAAIATTLHCRVLAIGNPDYEGSTFSKMCEPGSGWNVVRIDGMGTPNFTDEPVPTMTLAGGTVMPIPLLDQSFVDDIVNDYGVDSPTYMAKVRAVFPADRSDGVIPWSWAHQCRGVEAIERIGPLRVPVELGVDVGGGGDPTVIRARCGNAVGERWTCNTDDSEIIVDEILKAIRVSQATAVKVDFGGIGFGVTGSLRRRVAAEVTWPVTVRAVTFGGGAKDPKKFKNARAELWWEGRLRSKPAAVDAWDLTEADDRTMADLTEPRWFETKESRIQVEAKDEVRKRLGRSPDDGDAVLLAFYDPPPDADDQPVSHSTYQSSALDGTR